MVGGHSKVRAEAGEPDFNGRTSGSLNFPGMVCTTLQKPCLQLLVGASVNPQDFQQEGASGLLYNVARTRGSHGSFI